MSEEIFEDIEIQTGKVEKHRIVTLTDVIARLWLQKYVLIIWCAVGIALGVIIATGTPKEYTSTLRMVPEATKSSSGTSTAMVMLGLTADIATEDAYGPSFYPDIVSSVPFIVNLLDVEVQTSVSDTTYTLRDYLEYHIQEPWWDNLMPEDDRDDLAKAANEIIDPFRMNKAETNLCNYLSSCISTTIDKRTAEVTISVTMQDPLVSALLTDTVAARLQEYIIDYRTAKARTDLDYLLVINDEAQRQYYEAQQTYAEYMDRNQGLAQYSAQTTRDRLQNEMQLAFNLYNQTSQQVQQQEAKVQEQTPAFAVIEPSTVPLKPSKPKKVMIIATWMFAFLLIGIIVSSLPLFYSKTFKEKLARQKEEMQQQSDRKSPGKVASFFMRLRRRTSQEESVYEEELDEIEESDPDTYNLEDKGKQKK